jgi:hypothetical protein
MLSSNMLLRNLIPLIDVTFSTPTGHSAVCSPPKRSGLLRRWGFERNGDFATLTAASSFLDEAFIVWIPPGKPRDLKF